MTGFIGDLCSLVSQICNCLWERESNGTTTMKSSALTQLVQVT
jgi:hypothetical protein